MVFVLRYAMLPATEWHHTNIFHVHEYELSLLVRPFAPWISQLHTRTKTKRSQHQP